MSQSSHCLRLWIVNRRVHPKWTFHHRSLDWIKYPACNSDCSTINCFNQEKVVTAELEILEYLKLHTELQYGCHNKVGYLFKQSTCCVIRRSCKYWSLFSCVRINQVSCCSLWSPLCLLHSFDLHIFGTGETSSPIATWCPRNVWHSSHGRTSTQRQAGRWWVRSTQQRCRNCRSRNDPQTKLEEPEGTEVWRFEVCSNVIRDGVRERENRVLPETSFP